MIYSEGFRKIKNEYFHYLLSFPNLYINLIPLILKKITQIICILLTVTSMSAQQEKRIIGYSNWLDNWTEFKHHKVKYGDANQILVGTISVNTKLLKRDIYVLQGNVYVTNNAVLTIEPGTLITGDFEKKGTLVVTKGAQIIADALETDPIVSTSNRSMKKAGDWGGVVILGDAPINKLGNIGTYNLYLDFTITTYGGDNAASNSGILRFVRIEFAGKKVKGIDTFNGLTIAPVGNNTILENIMVRYSGGDSFAFFGGDVNATKFVSNK